MTVAVSGELSPQVLLGILEVDGTRVTEGPSPLDDDVRALEEWARRTQPQESSLVRTMYRRCGLDPTKTRPSSEALLRRVKRGDSFPRVNTLVDICNWCSLERQIPFGLYDAEKISGSVEFRLGRPGEEYAGIRKDVVHLDGRPTLADAGGPFGNPSADAFRTRVTTATTHALVILFGPRPLGREAIAAVLDLTAHRIALHARGRELHREIV